MRRREFAEELAAWIVALALLAAAYVVIAGIYRGLILLGRYLSVWMLKT